MAEFTSNQVWAATIVGALVQGGVRDAVIAPGSRSTPLALAFADRSDVKSWSVIDERSAAFFALGLAKGSRRPVAVLCTSGTAGAHFLPAVMEAREGATPLVCLTADRPWELHGFGAPQTIDQVGLFGKYVRAAESLPVPSLPADEPALRHLATVVSRAVSTALAAPRGPVHLNVPFAEPLAPANLERGPVLNPLVTQFPRGVGALESAEIVEAVARAERGLIVCGPQESDPSFGQMIHALARRLGFAVLAEAASNARFGFEGAISTSDALLRNEAFSNDARPDVVLRFGGGLTPKRPQAWLDACGAKIVQVHPDGLQFDPLHRASWSVRALPELPTPSDARLLASRKAYVARWEQAQQKVLTTLKRELAGRFDEPAIAATVVSALPPDTALVVSSSMPIRDVDAFATSPHRLHVFANRGVNGIDGVTSTALGVRAATDQPTVLLIGDVALLHDLTGWLIARRHAIPLTVVVVNNDGGGIFHFLPIADRTPHFEALFGTPHGVDLASIADLSGATLHRPTTLADLSTTVKDCAGGGLHLIEVRMSRRENVDAHRALFDTLNGALA